VAWLAEIDDLLERLKAAGVPIDSRVSDAMKIVDVRDFTNLSAEPFWYDSPVPFLITEVGAAKTISAPHMILTLLHHLELRRGQHVLLMGSKGGYISAILDEVLGPDGMISIVEPHTEVREHTSRRLEKHSARGLMRVLSPAALDNPDEMDRGVDRVLITGAVKEMPISLEVMVDEGGFVLGPFGGPVHQRLLKREKQGNDWFDTDLGGVVFGPMDLGEAERDPLDANLLADHLEDAVALLIDIIELDDELIENVEHLVAALRDLPIDLPILPEDATEDEILEHPVMDLIMSEMEWLAPIWPVFGQLFSMDLAAPGSPDDEEVGMAGGHRDLVP